jgi:heat-inducible transcriptional repressor
MATDRSLEVLRVIVQDYVSSREPVGSKAIVERHGFGVSAATIRNDMALLEEEELIAAPHTSSGRIPTDKGYRVFVDQLADLRPLTGAQKQAIETFLGSSVDLDDVLSRTVRLLSQLTSQVAMVQYPTLSRMTVRHIELVPLAADRVLTVVITDGGHVGQRVVDLPGGSGAEGQAAKGQSTEPIDEAFLGDLRARLNSAAAGAALNAAAEALAGVVDQFPPHRAPTVSAIASALVEQVLENRQDRIVLAGTGNLARTERDFPGSIHPVLDAIEEQVVLLRLFREMAIDQSGIAVSIGRENTVTGLAEASVLTTGYSSSSGELAHLGVLGPTRMDYSNNMAAVRAVARYLSRLLGEG